MPMTAFTHSSNVRKYLEMEFKGQIHPKHVNLFSFDSLLGLELQDIKSKNNL